jgi:hypothetical protein
MKLFRSGLSPHHTALAMIGAKPGASLLVVGASNPALAAELALITGLNGRTVVASADGAGAEAVQTAAARAGALVDFEPCAGSSLPFDAAAFDVVVLQRQMTGDAGSAIVNDAVRVTRTGGRVIAIEGEIRTGLLASMRRTADPGASGEALAATLTAAGLIAVRVLGESEGVVYAEGRKR